MMQTLEAVSLRWSSMRMGFHKRRPTLWGWTIFIGKLHGAVLQTSFIEYCLEAALGTSFMRQFHEVCVGSGFRGFF